MLHNILIGTNNEKCLIVNEVITICHIWYCQRATLTISHCIAWIIFWWKYFVYYLNMIHESLNRFIKTLLFQKQMSFTIILNAPLKMERKFENKYIGFRSRSYFEWSKYNFKRDIYIYLNKHFTDLNLYL